MPGARAPAVGTGAAHPPYSGWSVPDTRERAGTGVGDRPAWPAAHNAADRGNDRTAGAGMPAVHRRSRYWSRERYRRSTPRRQSPLRSESCPPLTIRAVLPGLCHPEDWLLPSLVPPLLPPPSFSCYSPFTIVQAELALLFDRRRTVWFYSRWNLPNWGVAVSCGWGGRPFLAADLTQSLNACIWPKWCLSHL